MATLRYIGSKKTLMDWLLEHFDVENLSSFAEPMAGTGIVSSTIAKLKPTTAVFANDICMYSSTLLSSLLKPFDQSAYDRYHRLISDESCLAKGFVYSTYGEEGSSRLYFNAFNAQRIDGARILINAAEDIDQNTKNALIATVMMGADKVANTTGVYVAFLKKFKNSSAAKIGFPHLTSTTFANGNVFNGDALDFIERIPKVDLMYLDPPYTNRGYCTYYHVLETIALYDSPTVRGVTGLREDDLSKNGDLYKKTTALKYFKKLFESAVKKTKVLAMSYSSDSIVNIDVISELLSTYGTLAVHKKEYKKYVSQVDQEGAEDGVTEYLLMLTVH